jgi:hypothetical protein
MGCKLRIKHTSTNEAGKTLVHCKLIGNDLCLECCIRVGQVCEARANLLLHKIIDSKDLIQKPDLFIEMIPERLQKYAKAFQKISRTKDWTEIGGICRSCQAETQYFPSGNPTFEPITYCGKEV